MKTSSTHLCRFRPFTYSFLILLTVVGIAFWLLFFLGAIDLFWALLSKAGCSFGNRALSIFLLKMTGCSGGVAFVLSFAWRALNGMILPDLVCWMDKTHGWTSILGSSLGGNSIDSSQGSVNQPVPDSPEPVAPAAPLNPEVAQPDEDRLQELNDRLHINSINLQLTTEQHESILETQLEIEKQIERALLSDGYSRESLIAKRHQIRGLLFYPRGTPFSESTYLQYLNQIGNNGVHHSIPYRRIIEAIEKNDLFIE